MTTTAPAPAPSARKPVEPGAEPPPPERKYVSRWIPAAAIVAVSGAGVMVALAEVGAVAS